MEQSPYFEGPATPLRADPIVSNAVFDFREFVDEYDNDPPRPPVMFPSGEGYLQDYLMPWLEYGNAMERCGGTFETFLRASLFVADAVFKDPSVINYSGKFPERRLLGIVSYEGEDSWKAKILSREYFESLRFMRQFGSRSDYDKSRSSDPHNWQYREYHPNWRNE